MNVNPTFDDFGGFGRMGNRAMWANANALALM